MVSRAAILGLGLAGVLGAPDAATPACLSEAACSDDLGLEHTALLQHSRLARDLDDETRDGIRMAVPSGNPDPTLIGVVPGKGEGTTQGWNGVPGKGKGKGKDGKGKGMIVLSEDDEAPQIDVFPVEDGGKPGVDGIGMAVPSGDLDPTLIGVVPGKGAGKTKGGNGVPGAGKGKGKDGKGKGMIALSEDDEAPQIGVFQGKDEGKPGVDGIGMAVPSGDLDPTLIGVVPGKGAGKTKGGNGVPSKPKPKMLPGGRPGSIGY